MDENDFWLRLWGLGAIVLIVLIISMTSYYIYETSQISDMVAHGVDPIRANCALKGGMDRATCLIEAVK